jgi:hypothetical protein
MDGSFLVLQGWNNHDEHSLVSRGRRRWMPSAEEQAIAGGHPVCFKEGVGGAATTRSAC